MNQSTSILLSRFENTLSQRRRNKENRTRNLITITFWNPNNSIKAEVKHKNIHYFYLYKGRGPQEAAEQYADDGGGRGRHCQAVGVAARDRQASGRRVLRPGGHGEDAAGDQPHVDDGQGEEGWAATDAGKRTSLPINLGISSIINHLKPSEFSRYLHLQFYIKNNSCIKTI